MTRPGLTTWALGIPDVSTVSLWAGSASDCGWGQRTGGTQLGPTGSSADALICRNPATGCEQIRHGQAYALRVDFLAYLDALSVEHGQGAPADSVNRAEEQLGAFPDDYRSFLRQVGWASHRSDEINGLGADLPHRFQDVVELTVAERRDGGLPETFIAIHADGGGNFTCLTEGQVVDWLHDDGPASRHTSFTAWLIDLLETPN